MTLKGGGIWLALIALVFLLAVFLGPGRSFGPPLDPSSTSATGTMALVELLEELGADVNQRLPTSQDNVVLVLVDRGFVEDQQAIESFVSNGGTAVIVDANSWLSPDIAEALREDFVISYPQIVCDIPVLSDVQRVSAKTVAFAKGSGERGCFGSETIAFVVSEPFGEGELVHIGGPDFLTNERLGDDDNAVLAVRLLMPSQESSVAVVFDSSVVPVGDETLSDLVPTRVRWFGIQLLVALGLAMLWLGRRFGRVVSEPIPVEMPGSLLVQASGELRRRSLGYGPAISLIREDLESRLRSQYRVHDERPIPDLIATVAAKTELTEAELSFVLAEPAPQSEEGLVALAAGTDRIMGAGLVGSNRGIASADLPGRHPNANPKAKRPADLVSSSPESRTR